MAAEKWEQRDRKVTRRSRAMKVTGRSVFVIAEAQAKRDRCITCDRPLPAPPEGRAFKHFPSPAEEQAFLAEMRAAYKNSEVTP